MSLPVLETRRSLLKAVTLEDAPAYERHFVDYEIIRHLVPVVPWPYPSGGVADFIRGAVLPNQGRDRWFWGIFLKSAPDELIGVVDLWRKGNPENRGFWLGRKFWGRGIMTEAVIPVTDCAFASLGFERLVFSNALGNLRSRRIKEKTGARFIGTEPARFVDPQYTQREIWELTREMWENFRASGSSNRNRIPGLQKKPPSPP